MSVLKSRRNELSVRLETLGLAHVEEWIVLQIVVAANLQSGITYGHQTSAIGFASDYVGQPVGHAILCGIDSGVWTINLLGVSHISICPRDLVVTNTNTCSRKTE